MSKCSAPVKLEYERQQALIDLYGKLAIAEQKIASGAEGEDFFIFISRSEHNGPSCIRSPITIVSLL